ncbi:MAG: c-type cytochrome biogenesis protein CcmI [Pseudomonadales bacterium]
MLFWVAAFVLAALAVAFIMIPGLFGRHEYAPDDRTGINVAIFEQRVAELENSLADGDIDQAEFDALKVEAEKSLVFDAGARPGGAEGVPIETSSRFGILPFVMAILVPAFAFIAYSELGLSWGSIADVELSEQIRVGNPHDVSNVQDNIAALAQRLQQQPDNDEGWFLLARSYMNLERFEEAVGAFRHLLDRYPRDSDLATYHAQALFLADKRVVTPRVDAAITQTLALDPENITMLEIRGIDAMAKQDYVAALDYFRRARGQAQGDRAEVIGQAIETVETMIRSQGIEVPGIEPGRSIEVALSVAEDVDVPSDASVFLFARAVNGPPMPLAVLRLTRADLPRRVKLTEDMGMTAGMSLADFDLVEVIARISLSGIATNTSDGLEARSEPVDLTAEPMPLTLEIRQ